MTFFSSPVIGRFGLAAPARDMDPLMVAFTFPIVILFQPLSESAASFPVNTTLGIPCNHDPVLPWSNRANGEGTGLCPDLRQRRSLCNPAIGGGMGGGRHGPIEVTVGPLPFPHQN